MMTDEEFLEAVAEICHKPVEDLRRGFEALIDEVW